MHKKFSKLKGKLRQNHLLATYTSWNIGGAAEYLYSPIDLEDLVELLQVWQEGPVTILGAGSNVLVRDGGIKGLVIYLRNSFNKIDEIDEHHLYAEAGALLANLVQKCVDLGISDAAFMAGIPGTVGGALRMNAGALGDSIWDYVVAIETINRVGEIKLRQAEEFSPLYRHVDGLDKDEWIVGARFRLKRGDANFARERVLSYLQKRRSSQPLNFPSCGSVFRNPKGHHAAKLIEESGLKGMQVGGARVSEKHANFIVNCGDATSCDVEELMQKIIETVQDVSGVLLVPEVHVLGDE